MKYYPYSEQDRHYREAAWDVGCTCPPMPAHTHLPACPLFETEEQIIRRLEEEHDRRYAEEWGFEEGPFQP